MTVADYLKNWLERIKETVEERTHETYSWHVKRLVPVVGQLQFYNLTAYELQEGLANTRPQAGGNLPCVEDRERGYGSARLPQCSPYRILADNPPLRTIYFSKRPRLRRGFLIF